MNATTTGLAALLIAASFALGAWIAARLIGSRADATERGLRDSVAALNGQLLAEQRAHADTRTELARQREHSADVDQTVQPMREALRQLTETVDRTERARVEAQSQLQQRVTELAREFGQASADVRQEARRLSTALSRSERRGAWGELQLRRLVESAGMLPHVHFVEQAHTRTDDSVLRPDLIVDLAGGRRVVVDAKVPLDAFLTMTDTAAEDATMQRHAKAVADHVRALSAKRYWDRHGTPEFVVMFLPSEGLFSAALTARPALLQEALDERVIPATPTTLLALLHTVHHAWRQVDTADQARAIQRQGVELYQRLASMAQRFAKLGTHLTTTVKQYDEIVGALEGRVLPAGRKLGSLAGANEPLDPVAAIDRTARGIDAPRWPLMAADDADGDQPTALIPAAALAAAPVGSRAGSPAGVSAPAADTKQGVTAAGSVT